MWGMIWLMPSLRRKIAVGYCGVGTLVILLAVLALAELTWITTQVHAGERVTDLFDATMEVRRFEKNLFLYGEKADLAELKNHLGVATSVLAANAPAFGQLTSAEAQDRLQAQLADYQDLIEQYAAVALGRQGVAWELESRIRLTGKSITTATEDLVRRQRRAAEEFLVRQRTYLILPVVLLSVAVGGVGRAVSTRVLRPLKEIEKAMDAIAAGSRARLAPSSQDLEVVSLAAAVDHLLDDLEGRQHQLMFSERLASLGTLVSGVAHELNNPLSNIATSSHILREELDEADRTFQEELLDQIDGEAARAQRIVASLLDLSRRGRFERRTLPLRRLVEASLRLCGDRLPPQIAVSVAVPDTLAVWGDAERLQQAVINLLRNAADAINGPGHITIDAVPAAAGAAEALTAAGAIVAGRPPAPPAIALTVRDDGCGMPPETLARVFDPFFTTKCDGGTGLGLFVVYDIVKQHGGCIGVASRPGGGASFHLLLPAAAAANQESEECPAAAC